jgi:hypothetical protein
MKNLQLKIGFSGFSVKMFLTTKDPARQSRNQSDRIGAMR